MKRHFSKFRHAAAAMLLSIVPFASNGQDATEFFSLAYSGSPTAPLQGSPGNVSTGSLEAELITPTIKLGKKMKLNNMVMYRLGNFRYDEETRAESPYPKMLTDIQYSLLFRYTLSDRWSVYAVPQIAARSDLQKELGAGDLFAGFTALAVNRPRKHKNLEIGYGISYTQDYTKNTLSPLLAVSYYSSRFRMEALLPSRMEVVMKQGMRWEYGLEASIKTGIYHISVGDGHETRYFRNFSVPAAFTVARNLGGMLWLKAELGAVFSREIDFLDQDLRISKDNSASVEPSPYAAIGISLRSKE